MKKYVFLFAAIIFIAGACTREVSLPGDPRYVDSIVITNKINDIIVGNQHQFEAAYYPWDAEGFDKFIWQSSDDSIATVDQSGLLKAVDEGDVIIKLIAEVTRKKGKAELTDEVTVRVAPIDIESIRLHRNDLEILNRSTDTLKVSFVPANAKPKEIEWKSSNETIASVEDGIVTAKSAGNTLITAQVKDTDIKATCNVKVNPIVVSSMQFEADSIKLEAGYSITTKLFFDPDSTENKSVTYSSSHPSIASVNSDGVIVGLSNGSVGGTGTGPGKATITATSVVTGVKATCIVEVFSVPDLVTVSIVKEAIVATSGGLSGYIKPTLHNNSSKSVNIIRFRILDRYNNFDLSVPISSTLEANSDYTIDTLLQFIEKDTPRAVFTFEFEGKAYTSTCLITR